MLNEELSGHVELAGGGRHLEIQGGNQAVGGHQYIDGIEKQGCK